MKAMWSLVVGILCAMAFSAGAVVNIFAYDLFGFIIMIINGLLSLANLLAFLILNFNGGNK